MSLPKMPLRRVPEPKPRVTLDDTTLAEWVKRLGNETCDCHVRDAVVYWPQAFEHLVEEFVKEVGYVIVNNGYSSGPDGHQTTPLELIRAIKKHFGVE